MIILINSKNISQHKLHIINSTILISNFCIFQFPNSFSSKYKSVEYHCPVEKCHRTFSESGNLITHIRCHVILILIILNQFNLRCFKCSKCEKSFKLKQHLNYHLKSHQMQSLTNLNTEKSSESFNLSQNSDD